MNTNCEKDIREKEPEKRRDNEERKHIPPVDVDDKLVGDDKDLQEVLSPTEGDETEDLSDKGNSTY